MTGVIIIQVDAFATTLDFYETGHPAPTLVLRLAVAPYIVRNLCSIAATSARVA